MNEQEIFLAALDISDTTMRTEYLNLKCGGNPSLRKNVDELLAAHQRSGEFLDVPALKQIVAQPGGETSLEQEARKEDIALTFLQLSTKPGSLGRLGHYEVQEVIGRGGCGIVLKAFDESLHRLVAIKVMAPELAATSPARKRFLREARAAAAVRHENVVSIHAVEDQPIPFLVMEYIAGQTLQQRIDQTGPLDLSEVLRTGLQIARGLEAAHELGLIHRDIKPGNILLEQGKDHIKITDFGLARTADDASVTQSGTIVGTPLYMSPEQAKGEATDPRSDLFSLGSVLYVMCSGRPPFRAATTLSVLKRVAEDQPRPIKEIIPEVPEWLCAIITKLHAKNPQDRFGSAQEMAELLGRCLAELQQHGRVEPLADIIPKSEKLPEKEPVKAVEKVTPVVRTSPSHGRRWIAAAAAILLGIAVLGVIEASGVTNVRGTVIRLFSPDGTLVVEVDDPDVSVIIDGEDMVITGAGAREIRLKPGRYKVQASKDGKVVKQELVTVSKNGRQVVRISKEVPPDDGPRKEMPGTGDRTQPAFAAAPFDENKAKAHQEAWAKYLGRKVAEDNSVSMKMTLIPPGTFLRGVLPGKDGDQGFKIDSEEGPGHAVEITRPYILSATEVTQEQFEKLMGRNPSAFAAKGVKQQEVVGIDTHKLPVERVTWFDAIEFCNKLSEKEGLPPYYELKYPVRTQEGDFGGQVPSGAITAADVKVLGGLGYRLPTEAEWEYACRAGTTTPFSFKFDYGTLGQYGWFGYASKRTYEVGTRKPNPFGLHDMHGNVHEWCEDWLGPYAAAPMRDPAGPATGTFRILRGGSWNYLVQYARSAWRGRSHPGRVDGNVGIRVARFVTSAAFAQPADPDRRAAEYVLSIGGIVQVNDSGPDMSKVSELPSEPFRLTLVNLLYNQKITATGLESFRGCKHVTILNLAATNINDAGLAHFKECKDLTQLNLDNTQVTDEGVANFSGCDKLTLLGLTSTAVTTIGLAHFKNCKKLTNLSLGGTRVTDERLLIFKDCKNLGTLSVHYSQVTEKGLAEFKDCTNLYFLDLAETQITDDALAIVKNFKNLESLQLNGTQVGDSGLAHLKDCQRLSELGVSKTKVTEDGLVHLKGCRSLTRLGLDQTALSDKSVELLSGFWRLRALWVKGTKISEPGVKKLAAALPQCLIESDHGTFKPKTTTPP